MRIIRYYIELRKKTYMSWKNMVEYRYLQTQFDVTLNVTLTSVCFVLEENGNPPKNPSLRTQCVKALMAVHQN